MFIYLSLISLHYFPLKLIPKRLLSAQLHKIIFTKVTNDFLLLNQQLILSSQPIWHFTQLINNSSKHFIYWDSKDLHQLPFLLPHWLFLLGSLCLDPPWPLTQSLPGFGVFSELTLWWLFGPRFSFSSYSFILCFWYWTWNSANRSPPL